MTDSEMAEVLHDEVALIFAGLEEMAEHMVPAGVAPTVRVMHSLNHIRRVADELVKI